MKVSAEKKAALAVEFNELIRDRILEKTESGEMIWRVKKKYPEYIVFTGRFSVHTVEVVVFPQSVVIKLRKLNSTSVLYDTRKMRTTEGQTPGILRLFAEYLVARHAAEEAKKVEQEAFSHFKEALSRSRRLPGSQRTA